jgi:tetratricopeptide (TPR) repeat protein
VSRPDRGADRWAARPCWWSYDDAVDAALLEVTGDGWPVPESLVDSTRRPPQRWGWLATSDPLCEVQARGFPRLQREPTGRIDEQLVGRIRPGTGSIARRYEVLGNDPLPAGGEDDAPPASGWAGMSGAAVFAGDLLVGLLRRDRRPNDTSAGTRLTATRARELLLDDEFRRVVHAHTGWWPALEPVEFAGLLAPAATNRDLRSPMVLLRPDVEAVTFHGRDAERADLLGWCVEGGPGLSVRVLTGPGGQGKTRLSRWLTGALRDRQWVAGHLRADLGDEHWANLPGVDLFTRASAGVLVVVDYAECRPRLVRELVERMRDARHPVRLLLLARSAGSWQTDAMGASEATHEILTAAPVAELAALDSAGQRGSAFSVAVRDLARLLGSVPAYTDTDWLSVADRVEVPHLLHEPRFGGALNLQMAALVALLQHGPAPVSTVPDEPVEATLLRHEERYWDRSAAGHGVDRLLSRIRRNIVAAAVLCGAADEDEALSTVGRVPHLPQDSRLYAASWLRQLYPAEPSRYWGSPQPDLIAEFLASRAITESEALLPALLTGASFIQQAQALTVCTRAVVAHANAGRTEAGRALLGRLDATLDLAPWGRAGFVMLEMVHRALPESSVLLTPFTVRLLESVSTTWREVHDVDSDFAPNHAMAQNNLAVGLGRAGQTAQGLVAIGESLAIYRRLVEEDPEQYEPDLAMALNNLSTLLTDAGQPQEALAAVAEAVAIRRRLAVAADLAGALSNLAARLIDDDRAREGLAVAEEAVAIYRRLVRDDPDQFERDLAMALNNVSVTCTKLGRHADALRASGDASASYERLAARDPDAYEPELVLSLNNLAGALWNVRRGSDAITVARRAVDVNRRLAAVRWDVHGPDLARSLNRVSSWLAEVGDEAPALAVRWEMLPVLRRLAETVPEPYASVLAELLIDMAGAVAQDERWDEALSLTAEGSEILRRLAPANPDEYLGRFLYALMTFSLVRVMAGRELPRALDAVRLAERECRALAVEDPDGFDYPTAIQSVKDQVLSALGRSNDG